MGPPEREMSKDFSSRGVFLVFCDIRAENILFFIFWNNVGFLSIFEIFKEGSLNNSSFFFKSNF